MIQEIGPYKFDNQYKNLSPKPEDFIIGFAGTNKRDHSIFIKNNNENIDFPEMKTLTLKEKPIFLFKIDDRAFFLTLEQLELPGYSYESIRTMRHANPRHLCFAGMTAYHLYQWYIDSQYCGHCGARTQHDAKERMMKCPECGTMIFPKIAPAVIIGVKNGDSLMMSHYAGREYKGRALLAGFCEIGETPEETVAREVMEEVGLKVKNITYYGSQPWGFDMNLLLGYYCDLDGDGAVTLDHEELADAGFVKRADIEPDSNLNSLTATMIEEFRTGKIM